MWLAMHFASPISACEMHIQDYFQGEPAIQACIQGMQSCFNILPHPSIHLKET
jgi:hypothetical protein